MTDPVVSLRPAGARMSAVLDDVRDTTLTPGAIQRSADHRYTFEGKTYPGVTGILKVLDKSGPLMAWAARNTAEAAVSLASDLVDSEDRLYPALNRLIDSVGPEGAIKALTARSSWKRDEAANLGSAVHDMADKMIRGETLGTMSEDVRKRVNSYTAWWQASGWTLRLSEAAVVDPDHGYGGTFDLLARDRDGATVLADIKTGKGVYAETALQLAAYGMAQLVAPFGSPVAYPMPLIDRYVVLHVTLEGVREIEMSVGGLEEDAFLACITLSKWADATKGKRL